MLDPGVAFLGGMALLITVPTLVAAWLLVPWRSLALGRQSAPPPPPRSRPVARAATGRTPTPMERVSKHRSVRPGEPRVARP
jgi:hypothetical protein